MACIASVPTALVSRCAATICFFLLPLELCDLLWQSPRENHLAQLHWIVPRVLSVCIHAISAHLPQVMVLDKPGREATRVRYISRCLPLLMSWHLAASSVILWQFLVSWSMHTHRCRLAGQHVQYGWHSGVSALWGSSQFIHGGKVAS